MTLIRSMHSLSMRMMEQQYSSANTNGSVWPKYDIRTIETMLPTLQKVTFIGALMTASSDAIACLD